MSLLDQQFDNILHQQSNDFALQNCQPEYTRRQLAASQQQALMSQLAQQQNVNYGTLYGDALANVYQIPKPPNIFVPLTQDEVDMAEAMYEVNKIAPGLKEEA